MPKSPQAISDGAPSMSTASNAPTTAVMSSVPASASASRASVGVLAPTSLRSASAPSARYTPTRRRNAGTPLSERKAAQSLLGHGFDVIPSELSDGSPRAATRGYSTDQLPGPTPSKGLSSASSSRSEEHTS